MSSQLQRLNSDPDPDAVDAVILAGGQGSRLRDVIGSRQKVAVPIDGRAMLDRNLWLLEQSGRVARIVVCAGFDAPRVREVVGAWHGHLPVAVVEEISPLGTGGALRAALGTLRGDRFVVMNGDSYFPVSLAALLTLHEVRDAAVTLAAARVTDARRYGRVALGSDGAVQGFVEKGQAGAGPAWINGGVYVIEREVLAALPMGESRSLERDVLEPLAGVGLHAMRWPGPFLDIGTPQSLAAAEDFFRHADGPAAADVADVLVAVDRDGTLIEERHYLSDPAGVALTPRAAEAVRRLKALPAAVAVVSNQAGVGRGYYGEDAVRSVNARVLELLAQERAAVDAVYYCPHAPDSACACRKPEPGMIERAMQDLRIAPRSIYVIGDNVCDVELAQRVSGVGILVGTGHGAVARGELLPPTTFHVRDLFEAAQLVEMMVRQDAWQRALSSHHVSLDTPSTAELSC